MDKKNLCFKLLVGDICRFINESKFGFVKGKIYYVIQRLNRKVVFSNKMYPPGVDYGLYDGGEDFHNNWEILNEDKIKLRPIINHKFDEDDDDFTYIDLNMQV